VQIVNTIVDKCFLVNLDKDISLPDGDTAHLSQEERDNIVGSVYRKLMEIESPLASLRTSRYRETPLGVWKRWQLWSILPV
jgi:hypothetical protein